MTGKIPTQTRMKYFYFKLLFFCMFLIKDTIFSLEFFMLSRLFYWVEIQCSFYFFMVKLSQYYVQLWLN